MKHPYVDNFCQNSAMNKIEKLKTSLRLRKIKQLVFVLIILLRTKMPNARRCFIANTPVFITSRIKTGLPLACNPLVELIIKSALASAQFHYPVVIAHFIFMGNHFHLILYIQDANDVSQFVGFLKKRITDSINRLKGEIGSKWHLGFDAPVILDFEKAIERITYLYTNPAKANLVDTISKYPGVSSFNALKSSNDFYIEEVAKIKLKDLPCIKNSKVTKEEISAIINKLNNNPLGLKYKLKISPYSFAKCFKEIINLTNQDLQNLILENIELKEAELKKTRRHKVLGADKLGQQSMFKKHKPKTFGKRMLCLSSCKNLRKRYIKEFRAFCEKASAAYKELKKGLRAIFPAGCFRPWSPPLVSCLRW